MSTTIANGYKLAGGISITAFVRSFESAFSDARYRATVTAIGELVREIEDAEPSEEARREALEFRTSNQVTFKHIDLSMDRAPVGIARDVLFRLQDALGRRFAKRVPSLDVTLSISFLCDPIDPEQQYALIYSDNDEYVKIWESFDGVEEFFYWNGTDSQLETMTRKEWKHREKTWDAIISRGRASLDCVTWTLDTFPVATMEFDDADVITAVIDARVRLQSSIEWAKRIWGNDDDTNELEPVR